MNNYTVSIIVPVYNCDSLLINAINSLINQTYKNIEIIIIDDGSNDDSSKIIEAYKKNLKNIKVISQKNRGPGVARNCGIQKASGEFLMFLDADDYFHLNYCEEAINSIRLTSFDFVAFGFNVIDTNNKIQVKHKNSYRVLRGEDIFKDFLINREIKSVVWNKIYRKSFVIENKIRFPNLRTNEDQVFNFQACFYAKNILISPFVFYFHRKQNQLSITSKISNFNLDQTLCVIVLESNFFDQYKYSLDSIFETYFCEHKVRLQTYILYLLAKSTGRFSEFNKAADIVLDNVFFKIKIDTILSLSLLQQLKFHLVHRKFLLWSLCRFYKVVF